MSKRIRLAKYSRKVVCCNHCPMLHEDERMHNVMICKAGMNPIIIMQYAASGIPNNCPLEEFND